MPWLQSADLGRLFRDNNPGQDIEDNAWARQEAHQYKSDTDDRRVEVKIFGDAATNTGDHAISSRTIESFCLCHDFIIPLMYGVLHHTMRARHPGHQQKILPEVCPSADVRCAHNRPPDSLPSASTIRPQKLPGVCADALRR